MKKFLSALLAVTMLLALFSGVVIFDASAVYSGVDTSKFVQVPIPGFNQYTATQMGKMAINSGDNFSFAKDEAEHTVITATFPSTDDGYGGYNIHWATAETFNQWNKNVLIDGISPFGDVDLSNKYGFRFKICDSETGEPMQFSEVGFEFGSSTKLIAIDFRRADYDSATGYYIVDFGKTGWYGVQIQGAGWYKDCNSIAETYYRAIDQFQIKFNGGATMAGETISFYFDDFYADAFTDTTALGLAIHSAEEQGIESTVITAATELYKDKTNEDQAAVDEYTAQIQNIIDEKVNGRAGAYERLSTLLDLADELGMFEESYPQNAVLYDADMTLNNSESTQEMLQYEINRVRILVMEYEEMDADLAASFTKAINAWKYNYTTASYKALFAALNDAWESYHGEGEEEDSVLMTKIDDAYAALVPALIRTTTDNLLDGWTTEAVNDVVTANSDRICADIGLTNNTQDVWDGGDFTSDTVFDADDNFTMVANADFTGKSIGWKNMDRTGTLAAAAKGGYPEIDATGLSECEGVRFKLETEGEFERLLVGISNCQSLNREDYALRITPDNVDADGYITVPFDYFENAWWTDKKFSGSEYDNVIVLIFQAYNVENGTSITISDFKGYKPLEKASAEDIAKLDKVVKALKDFDIDNKYTKEIEAAEALKPTDYSIDYQDAYKAIFKILSGIADPASAYVDVPGFSVFTQAEMNKFVQYSKGGGTFTKTENGMKVVYGAGSWGFGTGELVPDTGFGGKNGGDQSETLMNSDCYFGQLNDINGKNFISMLGGYTLNDIIGYRFKAVGGSATNAGNVVVRYKDNKGLWDGLFTTKHSAKYIDGYYTFYVDEIPTEGDWYQGSQKGLQYTKDNCTMAIMETYQFSGEMYGWQVILYQPIDRSALKNALVSFKSLELNSYASAMKLYYDEKATQEEVTDMAAKLVKEATPATPNAPVLSSVTHNSVTLQVGSKSTQYRIGELGQWTTNNVFEGLKANTEYKFYARVAPIGDRPASAASEALTVKTLKQPIEGTITIDGDAVYGETLTATVTGMPTIATDVTYTWTRVTGGSNAVVGSESAYTVVKDDIGSTLFVTVAASNLDGTLVADETAEVVKATPVVSAPATVNVNYGDALSTVSLAAAEASVAGEWAWETPDVVLEFSQSGSTFKAIFTPEDTDCYSVVEVDITVGILSDTEEISLVDNYSGITLKGSFLIGSDTSFEIDDIYSGSNVYLALLREAKNAPKSADGTLILFKNVEFASKCYLGKLTLSAQVSRSRAGREYNIIYFADGEVKTATGVVDANGIITIEDFVPGINPEIGA